MNIPFYKYQGTGNDFVLIDQRKTVFFTRKDTDIIHRLCDRKFGIGADGLILLQNKEGYDFEMVYFNADGRESSMCGNGGRCITAFANSLGVFEKTCRFWAIDGEHDAKVMENNWVELKMTDVSSVKFGDGYFVLDTGSPHYVIFVEDIDDIDIVEVGSAIRYSKPYRKEGINVNFVERTTQGLQVATYERGVENETLSCGTGVTAAALSFATKNPHLKRIPIETKGGKLEIKFDYHPSTQSFTDIWLCGPSVQVFKGEINS